jgi:Glycosyl hydrolase family 46/Right handed beta helix region
MPRFFSPAPGISAQRLTLQPLDDRCLPSNYFVATTGNDANLGTITSPFATVQHALNVATKPGDLIEVRGGTYHEKVSFPASGSNAGLITLAAYPGEHPTLDGTGVAGNNMVLMQNVSFVKLDGFEIENLTGVSDGSGVRVVGGGTNIHINDNTIHEIRGTESTGITVYGTSVKLPITNLIIDNNEIYNADPAQSEALTLNGNVTNFSVTGNRVHDVNNTGIDIVGGDKAINPKFGARNGVVRGNTVYNVHATTGGGLAAGIEVDGAQNVVVEYNVSHNNDLGIEVGAENHGAIASSIWVRDNLIYSNDKAGLAFGGFNFSAGRVINSYFSNNTLYNNDTQSTGQGQLSIQWGFKNLVTNNVLYASADNILISSDQGNYFNTLQNNLYFTPAGNNAAHFTWNGTEYTGLASFQAGAKTDTGSLFADPLFTDAAAANFFPLSNSPTIDAGNTTAGHYAPVDFNGRHRPDGGAPDIGAYEYVAPNPFPGQGLDASQKLRAEQLTSIFENDTTELQYAYVQALGDGRGYTAGRAGFTTATHDLLDVVERYTAQVPGNELAPFLPRLRQLDRLGSSATTGLSGFPRAWQDSAADPIFRAVQDEVVDETYYWPAVAHWNELGLHTALSLAAIYDAEIQHGDGDDPDGVPALLTRTAAWLGGTPATTGVTESAWLNQFLVVRRNDLAHSYNVATRAQWAQSVGRVDVFKDIVAAGNYDLAGPIDVNSPVYGDFVIS